MAATASRRPHWAAYLAVDSADAIADRAVSAGATLIKEPFDVPEQGRMAVLQDPTGAMFCIWQSEDNVGLELKDALGAWTYGELYTTDAARAGTFYAQTFGWTLKPVDIGRFAVLSDPQGATFAVYTGSH